MINCPSCKEKINYTLSICPECRSVLDEITDFSTKPPFNDTLNKDSKIKGNSLNPKIMSNQAIANQTTSEINGKHTNPTLIEFPNKNANLPEWRLKLQSAVKERKESKNTETTVSVATRRRTITTKNSAALAMDVIERQEMPKSANPLLELALRRIEKSRENYKEFAVEPEISKTVEKNEPVIKSNPAKTYNFTLPKTNLIDSLPVKSVETSAEVKAEIQEPISAEEAKPLPRQIILNENEIVENANTPNSIKPKIERFKTNKLPPLIPAKITSSFGRIREMAGNSLMQISINENEKAEARTAAKQTVQSAEHDEIDDIAPMSMRFNAALFDLIIGSFLSFVLLAPVILLSGEWLNFQGLFAFLATCSIVMFIYLTTSVGLLGKTFGMQLFSLEMVDVNDGDFPTFHQSAVSSSVYLLSLALFGIGFAAIFLNNERRAAHDLFSGTIVIKEI